MNSVIPGDAVGDPRLSQTQKIRLGVAFQFVGVLFIPNVDPTPIVMQPNLFDFICSPSIINWTDEKQLHHLISYRLTALFPIEILSNQTPNETYYKGVHFDIDYLPTGR